MNTGTKSISVFLQMLSIGVEAFFSGGGKLFQRDVPLPPPHLEECQLPHSMKSFDYYKLMVVIYCQRGSTLNRVFQ